LNFQVDKNRASKKLQADYCRTASGWFSTGHGSRDTGHAPHQGYQSKTIEANIAASIAAQKN
jgi:hypothetical protein